MINEKAIEYDNAESEEIIKLRKDRAFLLQSCKLSLRMIQGKQAFEGCSNAEGVLKGAIASVEESV